MKKLSHFLVLLLGIFLPSLESYAQGNNVTGSASQSVVLDLAPVIALKFNSTNSSIGNLVNLNFSAVHQYQNGVFSNDQELSISSNKNFKISVQSDASNFTYSGTATQNPLMPVNNTLFVTVKNNNTGGDIAADFNNNYHSLNTNSQDILVNGQEGGNKTFTVNYKAVPTLAYASGSYSVGVIYTATQP